MLSALTLRGRAFLAAGATAVVCAVLLDQPALTRVGVLLLAVPLLSALFLARTRHDLSLGRELTPAVLTAGQSARVDLHLRNDSRRHTGRLLLEEQLPPALGGLPRFVLPDLPARSSQDLGYQVRPELRGHYPVGPLGLRATDPFGMVETRRSFHSVTPLVVTPRTVTLPTISLQGAWTGSGENRPRAFATGSAEDVTVREYRTGDDLRRVHWRSTARAGDLMVRREEQPWQSRATILLDNRASAHRGHQSASSFETAVVAAASVALHLNERGYTLRLVTATGEETGGRWHELGGRAGMALLLEELAVVDLVDRRRLEASWLGSGASSGLLVGVIGALGNDDHTTLRQLRAHAHQCLAISLAVRGWDGAPADHHPEAEVLTSLGWRTSVLTTDGSLASAWQELGRSRFGAGGVA